MTRRFLAILATALAAIAILSPAGAAAAPGALRVLELGSETDGGQLANALRAVPGVATVDRFDPGAATPTAAQLATYDLVVFSGEIYDDAVLLGDRLAGYVDAGGVVAEFAYATWDEGGPGGRYATGGYSPFVLGPNDNTPTSLGERVVPNSTLLAGVGPFTTQDNTTNALSPGATLIAKWADGRNAIAVKGRVAAMSAGAYDDDEGNFAHLARFAVNAGNTYGRKAVSVARAGAGNGTVTSAPAGINCGAVCSALFTHAVGVTLAATPAPGSAFAGWSGDCSGPGACSVSATAARSVTATFASTARCGNPSSGTAAAETLTGSSFGDRLLGLGGRDVIRAGAGDDCVDGGAGNDSVAGELGKDVVKGGAGRDSVSGGDGNDRLGGGPGNDRLKGGRGRDRLKGGPGKDRLNGGKGANVLSGGPGNDVLNIDDGRKDRAVCGAGKDRVVADPKDRVAGCEKVTRR